MSIASQVDHEAMETAIRDWVLARLPSLTDCGWVQEDGPRYTLPFATLQVINDSAPFGQAAQLQGYNSGTDRLDVVAYTPVAMTVQVTLYTAIPPDSATPDARRLLSDLVGTLGVQRVQDTFSAAGLAVMEHQSYTLPDQEVSMTWEKRAVADIVFGYMHATLDGGDASSGADYVEEAETPSEADSTATYHE